MDVKNIIKVANLKNQAAILEKMDEMAVKSANGIYNCTTNQAAILKKMDELAVHSANGTYNITINERLTAIERLVTDIYEATVTKE